MSSDHLYSMEAERALLGSLLMETNQVIYLCRKLDITADSFYDVAHRQVFGVVEILIAGRKSVDLVSVTSYMRDHGSLDVIGGPKALTELVDSVATVAHAEGYAEIVREKHTLRRYVETLQDAQSKVADGHLEPFDAIESLQAELMHISKRSKVSVKSLGDLRESKVDQWRRAKADGFVGVPFCIPEVNKYLGGWRNGTMGIVAGYRGEGKSTLVRQDCLELAKRGFKVGLFTLEDTDEQSGASIAGNHADISTFLLDTGTAYDETIDKMDRKWCELDDLPLWIVGNASTIEQICSTATLLHSRHQLDIIYIDHIQYIAPYTLPRMSRNDTVATYSQRMIGLAKSLDIPVVAVSQFSRDAEKNNRKPRLSDLRDSGTLEQDARQILTLWYDGDAECHKLEVAKNNYGISGKHVEVERIDGRQRFEPIAASELSDSNGG